MNNIWKLRYDGKLKDVKEKIIQDIKTINEALKKKYSNNCVIVILSPCTDNGESIHQSTIHIYDNFLDANALLNKEQYTDCKNKTIFVIQYNLIEDKFLFILIKANDTVNYRRLNKRRAQKMFDDMVHNSAIKFLYNEIETQITLH